MFSFNDETNPINFDPIKNAELFDIVIGKNRLSILDNAYDDYFDDMDNNYRRAKLGDSFQYWDIESIIVAGPFVIVDEDK